MDKIKHFNFSGDIMRKIIFHSFVVFLTTLFFTSLGIAADYDHKIDAAKMSFEWKINGENIDIRMSAPTTGWVGIGFNPSKQMMDANFILGYVKDGKLRISDEFGKTTKAHAKDTKSDGKMDVINAMGSEENEITTISFSIPLDSGDKVDQALDPMAETTVLLAYGSGRDSFRTKHKEYATLKVNLSTGEYHNALGK